MDIINQGQSEENKKKYYQQIVKNAQPPTPIFKNVIFAFIIGGIICTIGQLLIIWFESMNMTILDASAASSSVLVFLTVLLTGLGVYDEITRVGGAGAIVPITGFANSMAAPAIEHRSEGFVFGVPAKLFDIAGPVLVYGIITSWIAGLIYYLWRMGGA